ncbi:MAG: hypothetical protein ACI4RV_06580, partial [Eubacteriales bacterium]
IARSMVTKYGMSENLGPIVYGENQEEVFLGMSMTHSRNYSETVASEIDAEVRAIVECAYRRTEQILTDHMDKLTFIAEFLITHEIMDEDQFKAVMNGEPTVEELEEIAKKKAEQSSKQNSEAKKAQTESEQTAKPAGIDPNASRYNIRRRIAEESKSEEANGHTSENSHSDGQVPAPDADDGSESASKD